MALKVLSNLTKIIRNRKVFLILFLIILLASFVRFINVPGYPRIFNQDEALAGYDAYSLFKTARDHRGNFLPIFFEGGSDRVDNRPPIYFYITIPFVAIFGLNEFATELPAILFGIFTVLLTYFLTKEIFKKETIALLAAFFLAISPWHVFLSRFAAHTICTHFFLTSALFFWFKAIKYQPVKKYFLYLSGINFGILLYTYEVIKVFLPFLFFGLIFTYYQTIKRNKKIFIITLLLFLLIVFPYILIHLSQWDKIQGRFNQVSIFNFSFWPLLLFFNYLIYLHPKFFLTYCLLPVVMAAMVGIYFLWQKRVRKKFQILFWLIIISLFPTALTIPNPHTLRASLLLPILEIVAAYGFYKIYFLLKRKVYIKPKKILISLLSVLFLLLLLNFDFLFKTGYPYRFQGGFYKFGYKEVISYIKEHQDRYEKIVFTDKAPHGYLYFLFYLKYDPKKFQNLWPNIEKEYLPDQVQFIKGFDKYKFCNIDECYSPNENNLYVARSEEVPHLKAKKIFYNLDGSVFRIITND